MRCLLGAVSYAAHARDGLGERVKMFKKGPERMRMLIGSMEAMANDIIGTVPMAQCRQLRNTMHDMDMRMVPRMTRMTQNVILEKDLAKGLIDIAMAKCRDCVEDEKSCRNCALYKILVGILPLDNYENGMLCPYSTSKWAD